MQEKRVMAAPVVLKAAKEDGVDLRDVIGTGRDGAITKSDYEAHVGKTVAPLKEEQRHPLNHLTETIGGMTFSRSSRAGFDASTETTLTVPKELKNPELEYRWVNDVNGRVDAAKARGYEIVDSSHFKDEKTTVRRRVGAGKDGADVHAQLMAIPKKWYNERKGKSEEERRAKEIGMFKSPKDENGRDLGGEFYRKEI